jgi:hypothetical protein
VRSLGDRRRGWSTARWGVPARHVAVPKGVGWVAHGHGPNARLAAGCCGRHAGEAPTCVREARRTGAQQAGGQQPANL